MNNDNNTPKGEKTFEDFQQEVEKEKMQQLADKGAKMFFPMEGTITTEAAQRYGDYREQQGRSLVVSALNEVTENWQKDWRELNTLIDECIKEGEYVGLLARQGMSTKLKRSIQQVYDMVRALPSPPTDK
jgi:hypothetical protein